MNGKTIVITGAAGFIGTRLGPHIAATHPGARLFSLDIRPPEGAAHPLSIDLLQREAVCAAFKEIRPDVVFHLAGVIFSKDWEGHYRGNVEATINVLEAVKEAGLDARVVVPGSAAEYGRVSPCDLPLTETQAPNPVSPYGVSKVWQTAVARYYAAQGVDVIIGRIFNVMGKGAHPGLSIGAFAEQLRRIKAGELPPALSVGNLKPRRDFIDVTDACSALAGLADKGRSGETYNICSGTSVSMREILEMMIETAGLKVSVTVDPERVKDADIDDIYGANAKMREETGWTPSVSLKESVEAIAGGF
ncbi:MAG: GDP-mannose 4,6-dehydratase [Deltaproteobacteria bacterium]|nr:GDP-mannose 4,6-dehydratase [Deltaproteobacteria bacterium]